MFACSVDGAGGCLAGYLGLAVAVEVIDHELGIVGSGADILAQIDAPQFGPVEFIAIEDYITCVTGYGVVL